MRSRRHRLANPTLTNASARAGAGRSRENWAQTVNGRAYHRARLRRRIPRAPSDRRLGTECCPVAHQKSALSEEVGSAICRLYLVRNGVRRRRFGDLARIIGLLRHPVSKGRSTFTWRTVPRRIFSSVMSESAFLVRCPWNTSLPSPRSELRGALGRRSPPLTGGTTCARAMFMRSAGGDQRPLSRSSSDQSAPRTSPGRAAVRIRPSSTRRPFGLTLLQSRDEIRPVGIGHRREMSVFLGLVGQAL